MKDSTEPRLLKPFELAQILQVSTRWIMDHSAPSCKDPLPNKRIGKNIRFDLEEVMAICGSTDTVLFGHIPRQGHEDAEKYLHRLAGLCGKFKARLILVSDYQPMSQEEKAALVECWHTLTAVR